MQIHQELEKKGKEEYKYLYVYGITANENLKHGVKGLKKQSIQKIVFKDIAALASNYPMLNPALKENEALQHSNILQKLSKKAAIIPASFGTVFKDKELLEIVLSKCYEASKQTLALIEGKIELGVKAVKSPIEYVPRKTENEILEPLNKLSVKSVKGDNFTERLLLNHSFLVEKKQFSKFSAEIAKLEKKHKNLKFIYTGPWPPYSFVNINIKGG